MYLLTNIKLDLIFMQRINNKLVISYSNSIKFNQFQSIHTIVVFIIYLHTPQILRYYLPH